MKKDNFIGTWKLVSFEISYNTQKIFPYGENPLGYLLYTENNIVSVQFMNRKRTHCKSLDYKNLSTDEKIEIAENYGGYFGKYEVKGDNVIHYPIVSAFPNFINTAQVRKCTFVGNLLVLECPYQNSERILGQSKIIWEKIDYMVNQL